MALLVCLIRLADEATDGIDESHLLDGERYGAVDGLRQPLQFSGIHVDELRQRHLQEGDAVFGGAKLYASHMREALRVGVLLYVPPRLVAVEIIDGR